MKKLNSRVISAVLLAISCVGTVVAQPVSGDDLRDPYLKRFKVISNFNKISPAKQVNWVTRDIIGLYITRDSFKGLNSKVIYASKIVQSENHGWDAGATEGGKAFFVSLKTDSSKQCEDAMDEMRAWKMVKSISCHGAKVVVNIKRTK